jgi:hypothetical protein
MENSAAAFVRSDARCQRRLTSRYPVVGSTPELLLSRRALCYSGEHEREYGVEGAQSTMRIVGEKMREATAAIVTECPVERGDSGP